MMKVGTTTTTTSSAPAGTSAVVVGGATATTTTTATTTADNNMAGSGCCFFGGGFGGNNNQSYYHPQQPSHVLSSSTTTPSSTTTTCTTSFSSSSASTTTTTTTSSSSSNNDNNNNNNKQQEIDDAELAKEMNGLSIEERERVYDDIHGCSKIQIESDEFIKMKIDNLNKKINELPRTKRQALDRAIFLKPSIESDIKFKLMFLRADNYDTLKASRRMAKYFTDKLKLFGEEKLVKKICLDDFTSDDMNLFLKGPFIFHNQRDNVGRPIWLSNVSQFAFTYPKSMTRVAWYMIMTSLEDEAAQLQGVCNVILCPDKFPHQTNPSGLGLGANKIYDCMVDGGDMLSNLPARVSSQHFCYTNSSLEFMLRAFRGAFGKHQRLRTRAHFGSKVEIQYSLLTYGISCPFITNNNNDEEKNEKQLIHQEWIKKRIEIEKQYQTKLLNEEDITGIIIYPQPNDVLVGRGCPYQTYIGNVNLSCIITTKFLNKYCNVIDRFEKTCIHMDVVKYIQDLSSSSSSSSSSSQQQQPEGGRGRGGGRFLERCKGGWIVVDDKVARKKVNSSFRSKIAKLNNHNTKNNNNKSKNTEQERDATTTNNTMVTTTPPTTTINNTPFIPSSLLSLPYPTSPFGGGGLSSSTNNLDYDYQNNNNNNRNSTATMQFTLFSNGGGGGGGGNNNDNNDDGYGGCDSIGGGNNNNTNKRLRYDPSLLA